MLGLVFGGGGAKGYAHIGVIKFLEQRGIKPDIVVGASMGALIGGFYAAGFSAPQMAEIALGIDKKRKRWLFRPRISKRGIVDGKNIVRFLSPFLGGKKIEELPLKYAAVATDIENLLEIIIDKGDLIQAIRASIAIPVVFIPQGYAGRVLIDGGFVSPLPITCAQQLGAKKIIAVNVLPKIDYKSVKISTLPASGKIYNIKKVFERTFSLINSRLIDYEVAQLKKGIVIDIDTRGIGMNQFERAGEVIKMGYEGMVAFNSQGNILDANFKD